MKRPPQKF